MIQGNMTNMPLLLESRHTVAVVCFSNIKGSTILLLLQLTAMISVDATLSSRMTKLNSSIIYTLFENLTPPRSRCSRFIIGLAANSKHEHLQMFIRWVYKVPQDFGIFCRRPHVKCNNNLQHKTPNIKPIQRLH